VIDLVPEARLSPVGHRPARLSSDRVGDPLEVGKEQSSPGTARLDDQPSLYSIVDTRPDVM